MLARRNLRFLSAAALVPMLVACGGVKVRSEMLRQAEVGSYRTYGWKSAAAPATDLDAPAIDARIRGAVDRELQARGYAPARAGSPDFLMDYGIAVRDRNTETFREWFDYRAAGGTSGLMNAWMQGYQEGTLVLGVFDGRTRDLVWRASATALLQSGTPGARLNEAVRRMLERFPAAGGLSG